LNISDVSKLSDIYTKLLENINDPTNSKMQIIVKDDIEKLKDNSFKIQASKKLLSNILSIPIYNKLEIIFNEYQKKPNKNININLIFPYNDLDKIKKYFSAKLKTSNENISKSQKNINKIDSNKTKLKSLQTLITENKEKYKNKIDNYIDELLLNSKNIIDNLTKDTNKKSSTINTINTIKKEKNSIQLKINNDNKKLDLINSIINKYTNDYLKNKYILLYQYINTLMLNPSLNLNNFKIKNSNNMIEIINNSYNLLDDTNKNLVNKYIIDNIYDTSDKDTSDKDTSDKDTSDKDTSDKDIIIEITNDYKKNSSLNDINNLLIFNQIIIIKKYYETKLTNNTLSLKNKDNIISKYNLPNLNTDDGLKEFNQSFMNCITQVSDIIITINIEIEKIEYKKNKNKLYFLLNIDNEFNKFINNIINLNKKNSNINLLDITSNISKYFSNLKNNNNNFISQLNQHNFLKDLGEVKSDKYESLKSFSDEYQKYCNELITKIKTILNNINKNKLVLIKDYNITNSTNSNNTIIKETFIKIISIKINKINLINSNKNGTNKNGTNKNGTNKNGTNKNGINNNGIDKNNTNKKGNITLVLPYTDIMFEYLLQLLLIIDFLTFFYE